MTRDEAFAEFLTAVAAAVPDDSEDWPTRRSLLRTAGMRYAHVAADEATEAAIKAVQGALGR